MSLATPIPPLCHVPDRQNACGALLSERRRLIDERANPDLSQITRAMLTNRLAELNDAIVRLNGGSER